ncbi:MAG TPA: AI-2E family transporter [Thermoanaerobaculia bacterium]|nr:AI-2E family transporter [Thermoanaerobaculia bacterium]
MDTRDEKRWPTAPATLRAAAIVFGVLIALRFLWIAHAIMIVAFLGMLVGLAVSKPVDWLERRRVRRAIGAPAVMLAVLALLFALGAAIAPSIKRQTQELMKELPQALQSLEKRFGSTPAAALAKQTMPPPEKQQSQQPSQQPQQQQGRQQQGQPQPAQGGGGFGAQIGKEIRGLTKFLFPVISSTLGAIGGLILILFIGLYIAVDPHLYRKGILHLVPHRRRARAEEVLDTLRDTLRAWLFARLIAMVAIGAITGIGLALLRVKGAVALGVLAGLLELIPFFGPFISAVPAIGIALAESPQKAIAVVVLYLIVQQLEGNVITPLILERRLAIPPVLTVVGVSAFGMVFGVLGMLIAEPVLAAVLVLSKMLYVEDVVGDEVKIGREE